MAPEPARTEPVAPDDPPAERTVVTPCRPGALTRRGEATVTRQASAPNGFSSNHDPAPPSLHLINPRTDPRWDTWLDAFPDATVFHTSAWAAVLEDTYGFKPVYLLLGDLDQPTALLPFMECSSPFTARRGVSLPFTDHVAPLVRERRESPKVESRSPKDVDASASNLELPTSNSEPRTSNLAPRPSDFDFRPSDFLTFARSRRWRTLECRGGGEAFWPSAPASLRFYRHTIDLVPDERVLFARLDSAVRRAIRKAERSGLEIRREQSREAVEIYYALHCQTRKKHGLPPQPISFFHNLYRHLIERDLGQVFLAYHHGRPVAGAVFLQSFRQALYKFGASDEANLELRANNLVFWTAIRHYAERGYQTLDLGRTSLDQSGLRRFKLGWGAVETTIEYVKFDLRRDRFLTERDHVTGWHTALFRRLPIPVLRWLGARLYPHLT
jgi:hypothetical protein